MKHNAKKGIFIIAVAGTMAGLSFGIAKAKEEEIYPILADKITIRYANEDSSSSTETTNTSSSNTDSWYADKDNNGIPDKIEELIASKNVDSIMGTTITACMNACLNIITFIYGLHKWKTLKNGVNETASEATKNVNSFASTASEITNNVKEQQSTIKTIEEKVTENIATTTEQIKAVQELKESNEKLTKGYSNISARLDAILANQALSANTIENIKSGVATTIQENVKGAIEYGSRTDKDKSQGE